MTLVAQVGRTGGTRRAGRHGHNRWRAGHDNPTGDSSRSNNSTSHRLDSTSHLFLSVLARVCVCACVCVCQQRMSARPSLPLVSRWMLLLVVAGCCWLLLAVARCWAMKKIIFPRIYEWMNSKHLNGRLVNVQGKEEKNLGRISRDVNCVRLVPSRSGR